MSTEGRPSAGRPRGLPYRPDGSRYTWGELLCELGDAQREEIMRRGTAPAFRDLVGWEYGGANSIPALRLVGIRKFVKGFYRGPARASGPEPFIQGYNIPVVTNGDHAPHVFVHGEKSPKRFGFYRVHRPVEGSRDAAYPNGLLLDYSRGGNGPFGPPLRDYLVQVYPDDPSLLLGKAYVALLGARVPTSYFVLKRRKPHRFTG